MLKAENIWLAVVYWIRLFKLLAMLIPLLRDRIGKQ